MARRRWVSGEQQRVPTSGGKRQTGSRLKSTKLGRWYRLSDERPKSLRWGKSTGTILTDFDWQTSIVGGKMMRNDDKRRNATCNNVILYTAEREREKFHRIGQVVKTLTSTTMMAKEERWRWRWRKEGGVIIHRDKWMCHRGSTFSDAISSSHLLLDSFQVDSLQDTAAIFRGERQGGGKQQTHARVWGHLWWFVFLPKTVKHPQAVLSLSPWQDSSHQRVDFPSKINWWCDVRQKNLCLIRLPIFFCTRNGSEVSVKWRTCWDELN